MIFKILKNEAFQINYVNFSNHENGENLAFSYKFLFLVSYKIRTRTNFKNFNGKSLDLHLIMLFIQKKIVFRSNRFYSGNLKNTTNF